MFSAEWKEQSSVLLKETFQNYRPRSENFSKHAKNQFPSHSSFNFLNYQNAGGVTFSENWAENSQYKELCSIFKGLYDSTLKLTEHYSFITFSTDLDQTVMCPPHIHNFLQGEPCHTTTFGVPLYCGKILPEFLISKESKKWPSRWYVEPQKIKDVEYNQVTLSTDKILKLEFNSSFHPHYITYTDSIVAWLVIDGCDHSHDFNSSYLNLGVKNFR